MLPPGKTRITIRLDNEVLEWFRSQVEARGGGSYQAMINNALREHVQRGGEALELYLRRIIREELGHKDSGSHVSSIPARPPVVTGTHGRKKNQEGKAKALSVDASEVPRLEPGDKDHKLSWK